MIKSIPLNVRIPVQLQKDLESFSRSEHVPISDLVRDSLREFVNIRKLRKIQSVVRKAAKKAGYLTDDDVFERIKS